MTAPTTFADLVLDRLDDLGEITSHVQALTVALTLAVIAPDEGRALQAVQAAYNIASGLSEADVERATDLAEFLLADEFVG
jgi:hypothetical protein